MPKITVATRSFTPARDGANTSETVLTPAAIRARGIARLFTLQTQGDARGCEAQPLIVPDVLCADGFMHDLAILATMGNYVYAFDANDGTLIWTQRLGNPIKGTRAIDGYLINDGWGILSTPVYDPASGTICAVSWSSPDRTPGNSKFRLVGLAVADGMVVSSVDLSGATYTPGNKLPVQKFASAARKQRCGLLLSNGLVYIAFGTIAETAATAQGWVIAVDTARDAIKGAWTTTVKGSGAGLWMAGQGLSADAAGNVYAMTGNGAFDGMTDFGESFVKLAWVRGKLTCVDHFTPWTDAGREGQDPTGTKPTTVASASDDDDAEPTNVRNYAAIMDEGYSDMDLGSGGPLLIKDLDLIVGAGKDGIAYPVRMSRMGGTLPADLANPAANYAKLASPAIWFTHYPAGKDSVPQDVTALNFLWQGFTHHQHSTPVYWKSARNGHMLFTWGENGALRAWSVDPKTKALRYLASGNEIASAQVTQPPGGMPGGMISLSANGGTGGVLWAMIPYLDANRVISPGRLLAYDADDVTNGVLKVLWDSQTFAHPLTFAKFNPPIVANGKLYVPTYDGAVQVYGSTPI